MTRVRPSRFASLVVWLSAILISQISSRAVAVEPSKDAARITVHADRKGAKVSPLLYGIFFEDINCSADGGLYAELVRNRSFEDADTPEHWNIDFGGENIRGEAAIDTSQPISPRNRRSLKVTIHPPVLGFVMITNEGYWGIPVKEGEEYRLSLRARAEAVARQRIKVSLVSEKIRAYATKQLPPLTDQWQKYECVLKSDGTDPKARLQITSGGGTFYLDMVSLFPAKTWKDRPQGLRPDLAAMLVDLKPAFVRFPGGCWVEGDTMKHAYRWKETIGEPSERRTQFNIWNYHATHGLGFHEYLQMCEDLGAEPLFVINCGMAHRDNIPMDRMGEFVQDALDAIEYCNGAADSTWGSLRARNGHPAPFNLKYIEIGNENGGPAYQERYALFHDAIKKVHPEMVLIANVPTTSRTAGIIDEHYYSTPEFFIQQAERYDTYDRKGPKIYVGEYAVTQGCGKGNLRGAVGEAAFMVGMERNSDVVVMSSYAPLFVNVNHRGWNPDLINFDGSRAYGIPSFYVQKMFAENRGDVILPAEVEAPSVEQSPSAGRVGVGTWATEAEYKDLKVTRDGETLWSADLSKGTEGWKLLGGDWKVEAGALRQSNRDVNIRALAGDPSWRDYTFSLKARKLGGAEGFLILFRVGDENQKSWWNIGGWGNTRHAIEIGGEVGRSVPGRIETGRWYDIRVELQGSRIRCYLDGQLVHDVTPPRMKSLHASATRSGNSGTVVLKVVNTSEQSLATAIRVDGVSKLGGPAEAIVLTSASPTDENTLEHPTRVAPAAQSLPVAGNEIRHAFPGNSVTVIRVDGE